MRSDIMRKFNVGDYVQTKYGIGTIIRIWELNDVVNVYDIQMDNEYKVRSLFYSDIIKIINN
jgi:hypothetical protein